MSKQQFGVLSARPERAVQQLQPIEQQLVRHTRDCVGVLEVVQGARVAFKEDGRSACSDSSCTGCGGFGLRVVEQDVV